MKLNKKLLWKSSRLSSRSTNSFTRFDTGCGKAQVRVPVHMHKTMEVNRSVQSKPDKKAEILELDVVGFSNEIDMEECRKNQAPKGMSTFLS